MTDTLNATDARNAARKLGVTRRAVVKMINRGDIEAQKIGNAWAIPRSEVRKAKQKRKGNP